MSNFMDHLESILATVVAAEKRRPKNELLYHDCFLAFDRAENNALWRAIDASPGWVQSMPEFAETREALAELRDMGEVLCVTSPHTGPYWVPERFTWLKERGFTKKTSIFTGGKYYVPGDIFVDDHPEHIVKWAAAHPGAMAVLKVHPDYAPVPADTWPAQVSSWADIIAAVRRVV
jgi:5'(3')-deoxyribonucleotidase